MRGCGYASKCSPPVKLYEGLQGKDIENGMQRHHLLPSAEGFMLTLPMWLPYRLSTAVVTSTLLCEGLSLGVGLTAPVITRRGKDNQEMDGKIRKERPPAWRHSLPCRHVMVENMETIRPIRCMQYRSCNCIAIE